MQESITINSALNNQPLSSNVKEEKIPASPFDHEQARRAEYLDNLDIAVELTGKLYETVKDSEENEQAARSGLQQVANFYCEQIVGVLQKVDPSFGINPRRLQSTIHARTSGRSWQQEAEDVFQTHTEYARRQTLEYIEQITKHEELKKVEDGQLQQIEDMQLQSSARRLMQEVQNRRLRQIEDNHGSINKMWEQNENMLKQLVPPYLHPAPGAAGQPAPILTSWKHVQDGADSSVKMEWDTFKECERRIALHLGVQWSEKASAEFYIKNKALLAKYLVPTNEVLEPIENRSNRSEEPKELLCTLQSMRKLVADVMAMSEEKKLPQNVSHSIDASEAAESSLNANA